jgi:hypothetical protein
MFRLLYAVCFLVPVLIVDKLFRLYVLSQVGGGLRVGVKYIEAVVFFALFLSVYRLYAVWIERRRPAELSRHRCIAEFGRGLIVACGLVGLTVSILAIAGCYRIMELNSNLRLIVDYFANFTMGALMEEILFRLIVFRLTEEWLGTRWALAIQMVLFGFAHILNDNATIFTCLTIAVVGGLLYTAAFMYTHRIWLVLGIHAGWNYFQSGVFGMPNSGSAYEGVLMPIVTGPTWLTGGVFGIEASVLAVSLTLVCGIILVFKADTAGHLYPPHWNRKRSHELSSAQKSL